MAVQYFADDALAVLRPLYPDYDLWWIKRATEKGFIYCARRKGEKAACVNAASPEELIEMLLHLPTQP